MSGENEQDSTPASNAPEQDPDTGDTYGVSTVNGDEVTQPHPYEPGYGVTGKFPTDDADAGDAFDAGEPIETSEPASETDALAEPAPAPATVELPAAEADQLDVPADQRSDTA